MIKCECVLLKYATLIRRKNGIAHPRGKYVSWIKIKKRKTQQHSTWCEAREMSSWCWRRDSKYLACVLTLFLLCQWLTVLIKARLFFPTKLWFNFRILANTVFHAVITGWLVLTDIIWAISHGWTRGQEGQGHARMWGHLQKTRRGPGQSSSGQWRSLVWLKPSLQNSLRLTQGMPWGWIWNPDRKKVRFPRNPRS